MATWNDFLAKKGSSIYEGGNQCVAVANWYHKYVLGLGQWPGVSSAAQWWEQYNSYATLKNNYIAIPATQGKPQVGDICVERRSRNNGEHGHICVVVSSWNGSSFQTYDQNVNGQKIVFQLKKTGAESLGYLRPKAGVVAGDGIAFEEEVLTPEQVRMLNEIYTGLRVGSSSIEYRLNMIKESVSSVLATVSEMVNRDGILYTQKDDRAMTQDFLVGILSLLDEIDAGFESVGYDNIAGVPQINYYQSEADPGETSIEETVRSEFDKTKLIK